MSTPAKVSGPGKFSQRTDIGQPKQDIPNADYGEQKAYQAQQSGAPMASAPSVDVTGMDFSSLFGSPSSRVVPMGAETQNPNEPVTTAPMGGPPQSQQDLAQMANQLPVLEWMANQPNASWGLRNQVRSIKGAL